VLEAFYITLLIVVFLAVTWFAGLTVFKLFKGQD
jgi:hypothetical protein